MADLMGLGRADIPYSPPDAGVDGRDALGLSHYARALAEFVSKCQTPMTVGIQGEWGSGKTSLMNMVRAQLEPAASSSQGKNLSPQGERSEGGRRNVHLHTFETWQYGALGNDELLGLRLMSSVVSTIVSKADQNNGILARAASRVRGATGGVMKAVAAGVVNSATMGIVDGGTLVDSMDGWGGPQSSLTELERLRNDFKTFVEELVKPSKPGGGRVVVMIDDLDRIRPGKAIALLEVLKNFMDVPGCVFVVACDYEVVRLGVKEKLGIEDETKVRAFFDKIIQVPFQMPIAAYRIDNLLREFVVERVGRNSPNNPLDSQGQVINMVAHATGTNPRSFKRFLNSLDLLACLEEMSQTEDPTTSGPPSRDKKVRRSVWADKSSALSLMSLVAMQVRWPRVAAYLAANCSEVPQLRAALTTLRGTTEEDGDEQQSDGELRDRLRKWYPATEAAAGEHPEVAALMNFMGALWRVLDVDRSSKLEDSELESLARWVGKLSLTGVDKTSAARGGWQEFMDTMKTSAPGHVHEGIPFLDDLFAHRERLNLVELIRQSNYFTVRVPHGNSKLSVFTINPSLRLTLSGKPTEKYVFPAMEDIARKFVEATKGEGLSWVDNKRGWYVDLDKLPPSKLFSLSRAIKELLTQVDASAHPAPSMSAPSIAPSPPPGSMFPERGEADLPTADQ